MTYSVKIGISAEEHDQFVINHPLTNILQSSSWANIKDTWGNDRIGFYENDQLVAVASVLVQPLPFGFTMIYSPRGPIMDYSNKELLAFVVENLKKYGKKKKAVFIKCDPFILLADHKVDEESNEKSFGHEVIKNLTDVGAYWTGRTADLAQNIQPRFQANIYSEGFSESALPKKIRQNIRSSRNKGVEIIFGGMDLVDDFAKLMKKTEERKHIHLRGKDYYEKLLKTYGDNAYITMARLNLNERLEQAQTALNNALKLQKTFTEETRQSKVKATENEIKRHQKDIAFFTEKLEKEQDIVPLAATLSLNFGDTSENIYAGMDEDYKQYNAPLITWFETAQHAFEKGAKWQNMGGIENQLDGGLYQFKSKFNPMIEEFIGEFNIPVNPLLYHLSNTAYTLRKKLRSKH
ncbi:aminoacyltransferase [Streptococcus thoraltensis]|uniref:aminoacyltransferase n=1 Tax=Streptococcus thoraltensis TaxID=55085 RepID=UPI00037706C4|nr:aminoacyltransferase [Streptococcus thoraltensis]MDY4762269.1 aminoacyltransferase [Streptococcus thoraltensis]